MKPLILSIVVILSLLFLACSDPPPTATPIPTPTPVPFTNLTFKVPAGESHNLSFDLRVRDRLEIRFQSELDIGFAINGPDDTIIRDFGRVEVLDSYTLHPETSGRHTLFFDNGFSVFTGKTVTIVYRVVPQGGR